MLPREEKKSERAVEAAAYGTAAHNWKETGEFGEGRLWTTLKKKVEGVSREELWPAGLHEVPVAYNVLSGEAKALVLPVGADVKQAWKAAMGHEWVVGTLDFAGLLLGGPWVDDLKTGRIAEWGHYAAQQTFYLMTWTIFTEHALVPGRSTITHWPRYPLATKPQRYGQVLEEADYLDFQVRLRNLYADYVKLKNLQESGMDVTPRLKEGGQCVYCPSKLACSKGMSYDRD